MENGKNKDGSGLNLYRERAGTIRRRLRQWGRRLSIGNKDLHYKLNIIFALFFLIPVIGFLYLVIDRGLLADADIPVLFIGFLISAFLGLVLLRTLFDQISQISKDLTDTVQSEISQYRKSSEGDELASIETSFKAYEGHFQHTFGQLERRMSEINVLKELSDLCYVTFDPQELLYLTLERALKLVNADMGSILILDSSDKKSFVVKATIGLGERLRIGDIVDFDTSIAKYAVINKSPLVVEDLEKDTRFGRINRPQYGSKSFVCMPIKTIRDIIGVLNISRHGEGPPFVQGDIDTLIPLLSNAAFTYENLRLLGESELGEKRLRSLGEIFKVINSSLRETELNHAILKEIESTLPIKSAVVMVKEDHLPDHVVIRDVYSLYEMGLNRGDMHYFPGTLIDRVFKQGRVIIVEDESSLSEPLDKLLFENNPAGAMLLAPLMTEGAVNGVLAFMLDSVDFFYEDRRIIEMMANGFSLALEKNRLSSSAQRRAQELDTIKQIGSALASSTFEMTQVLRYTMDMIRVLMNVEAGSLLLVEGDELEFRVAFNVDVEKLRQFRIKIGQGIVGYVAARGVTVIENDAQNSSMFFPAVDRETGYTTKTVLCVPMISQGKVMGVIEVLNKIDGRFDSHDEHLLQSIASSVSIAIENSRLYRETVSMAENERGIRQMFQKFVPKEIVDKIIHGERGKRPLVEEFRTLTLLNIDIRNFSGLSIDIGPQKTVALLNYFFSVMGTIVFSRTGIVDKYLGDGFLAVFGAPVSSASDADNAVMAALEMQRALADVNKYFESEMGKTFDVGISIHTGEVIVGNIGFEKKMDYTVIGDSVNAVFTLQRFTKAVPNSILISEKTLRATQSPLKIREVKVSDIEERWGNMKVYEVLGKKRA